MGRGTLVILTITVITIALAAIVILILAKVTKSQQQKSAQLKQVYEEALRSGDRAKALQAGRLYYASFRPGNRLTTYDEQALANDLKVMDTIKQ